MDSSNTLPSSPKPTRAILSVFSEDFLTAAVFSPESDLQAFSNSPAPATAVAAMKSRRFRRGSTIFSGPQIYCVRRAGKLLQPNRYECPARPLRRSDRSERVRQLA